MKTRILPLLGFCLMVLFSACKKDEEGQQPAQPDPAPLCRPLTILENSFLTEFKYDTANRLERINGYQPDSSLGEYLVYSYGPAGKITKIESFDDTGTLKEYYVYDYDAQNRLVKTTLFSEFSPGPGMPQSGYETLEYNAQNQLVKTTWYEEMSTTPEYHLLYTYTNGNVTLVRGYEGGQAAPGAVPGYTAEFTYDNKANPFKGLLAFELEHHMRLSNNNVLTSVYKDENNQILQNQSMSFTYQYNAQGFPVELEATSQNNYQSMLTMTYACP